MRQIVPIYYYYIIYYFFSVLEYFFFYIYINLHVVDYWWPFFKFSIVLVGDVIKCIDHNHVPDISKIEAKKTVNLLKEYATTVVTTRAILGEMSAQVIK
jgi:hypothetical protein